MKTKKFIKAFSFTLIFSFGMLLMQSCTDKKGKKVDKQTTEVKAKSDDSKCGKGKCGDDKKESKCGGDKAKDSTITKESKCGEGKCGN